MAENVLLGVVGKKELIEGAAVPARVAAEIERSAIPAFYLDTDSVAKKIVDRLVKLAASEALPKAEDAGMAGAKPILKAMGETNLTRQGLMARGPILAMLQRRERLTLRILRQKLEAEAGGLSLEIKARFTEAERSAQSRKQLVDDLVAADKAELRAVAKARAKVVDAEKVAAEARDALAGNPEDKALQAALDDAEAVKKAASKAVPRVTGFLGRLESKTQGHFRDAIRRTAEDAQHATFVQRGFKEFAWIAVNGTDACPDCEARHGRVGDSKTWAGQSPGDGGTVCKSACMCHLVPYDYAKDNTSLLVPLTLKPGPSGKPPGRPAEESK